MGWLEEGGSKAGRAGAEPGVAKAKSFFNSFCSFSWIFFVCPLRLDLVL